MIVALHFPGEENVRQASASGLLRCLIANLLQTNSKYNERLAFVSQISWAEHLTDPNILLALGHTDSTWSVKIYNLKNCITTLYVKIAQP